jgi:YVTN family beta-propeller protein
MTLDAMARQAAEKIGPRPSFLGPVPFPQDLVPGRWRRARRPASLLIAALAIALAMTRLQLAAPPAPPAMPPLAHIAVGRYPTGPAVDNSGASVWVANSLDATVSHVDASTHQVVATIGVGRRPIEVAVGLNAIWVLDQNGDVAHVDPASDRVIATLPIGIQAAVAPTTWIPSPSLAAAGGAVWVAEPVRGDAIVRIDPIRDAVVATVHTGHVPLALAASNSAVWAANQDGTLTRVEATSGHMLTTTVAGSRPSDADHIDLAVAVGPSGAWVADGVERVLRKIDPASGRVIASTQLALRPAGLAVTATRVWVEDQQDGSLTCISPDTATTVGTMRVVTTPSGEIGTAGLAADPQTVWIADPRANTLTAIDGSRACSTSTMERR